MSLILDFFSPAEFAEMQLNITDIKRDLVSTGIPYHTYQSYTQYILFPKEVEAATMVSLLEHSGVCIHIWSSAFMIPLHNSCFTNFFFLNPQHFAMKDAKSICPCVT